MPSQLFDMKSLDTVDLSYNQISVWVQPLLDDEEYTTCVIKTLDLSMNVKLKEPPVDLLKNSSISKLQLTGCDVSKKELMDNMDSNGVFEY